MRRIIITEEQLANERLRDLLDDQEYFLVEVGRDGGEPQTCAFVRDDDTVFLCSNFGGLDGQFTELREELDYEYSWSCGGFLFAEQLERDNDHRYKVLGLVLSDGFVEEPLVGEGVFIHNEYTQSEIYRKQRGYHYHHGRGYNDLVGDVPNDSYRIGVELEVEAKGSNAFEEITGKVRSNWVYMERDGSLNSNGIEFITIPLLPKHAKSKNTWTDLVEYLKPRAVSWDSGRCGLHVHIGRGILGTTAEEQSETLGKLLYLYHHYMKDHVMNHKIFGRERGYEDREGKVVTGESVKALGSEVLAIKSVKDKMKSELINRSHTSRYFDINTENIQTIEFRKGRGSINAVRITAVIEWCELYCLYARKAKWQSISGENFLDFVRKKVKKSSSLAHYIFGADADC